MKITNIEEVTERQAIEFLTRVVESEDFFPIISAWAQATERVFETNVKWLIEDLTMEMIAEVIMNTQGGNLERDNDYFVLEGNEIVGYYESEIKEEIISDLEWYALEILEEYLETYDIDIETIEFVEESTEDLVEFVESSAKDL